MPGNASSRPDLVSEMRLRVPLPLVVPIVAVAIIFVCAVGFSRVLLGVTPEAATAIALVTAANILVAGALIALRPRMHRVGVLEVALIAIYPVLVGLVLAYTGVGAESEPATEEPAAAESQATGQGSVASGADVTLVAESIAFNANQIRLPAGEQVSVTLDNQDTVPHDFAIYQDEQDGQAQSNALFKGDSVDGGASDTYEFKAPKRGDYYFQCDLHPTMNGDVTTT
jgi:plastocyanin